MAQGFELFSIRDKDIPMEVLELPNKNEKIHTFAWEPKGHRFAVVHGDGPRPSVSFYTMRDEKNRLAVKHLGTWNSTPNRSQAATGQQQQQGGIAQHMMKH